MIEGRGYANNDTLLFNAFGIISFDPNLKTYNFRSYAQGQVADFKFIPTVDGYSWEIPTGLMTLRYTAVIKAGSLHEVGDRLEQGKKPVRFFEMNLTRMGDSDWPLAGIVLPK